MWSKIESTTDRWLLAALRITNLIFFLAIVLYVGEWMTGLDVSKIIVAGSIIWAAFRGIEFDFISWTAKKIISFGWGLSFSLFVSLILFMWNSRGEYIGHFKELSCKICQRN